MSKVITASLVKELRERTGGGLLECKKVLEEADGSIEKAIELMRKSGVAKAAKKSGRVAAEGIIAVAATDDAKKAMIVEVNCETDFVGRSDDFANFVDLVAKRALAISAKSIEVLLASNISDDSDKTIAGELEALIGKIGEKIAIRRLALFESEGIVGSYIHSKRIGVLVNLSVGNAQLGKDIAMHIAASKPLVISSEFLSKEIVDKEREIYLAQVQSSGKPPEIMQKMVDGKLNKFMEEVTLLKQPFIKDPSISVGELLKKENAAITEFVRFEVGEGIEKKEVDFATEVMAQVKENE